MAAPAEQDKLAEVVEAGTAIARGLDLDDTLRAVVEAATRVTGAAYGALGVLGPDHRISRFITTGLSDEQRELLGDLPTGRGILGVLIDEARPLRLLDLSDDPRSGGFPPNHPPMHSFLGVPVAGRGAVYGNLYLTEAPDGAFTDEDERIVVLLAGMAAVAIENARLYQDATEQAEQARRAAEARVALTGAAAAVLHEHDLMEALRLVAREAVRLLQRAARRRRRAGRVRRRRSATRSPRVPPPRPSTPPPCPSATPSPAPCCSRASRSTSTGATRARSAASSRPSASRATT